MGEQADPDEQLQHLLKTESAEIERDPDAVVRDDSRVSRVWRPGGFIEGDATVTLQHVGVSPAGRPLVSINGGEPEELFSLEETTKLLGHPPVEPDQ